MFSKLSIPKASVFLLLILHSVWIANHLRLVANDAIDPWKLGGYGMYTVPAPRQTMLVHVILPGQQPRRIPNGAISTRSYTLATYWTNRNRTFRCAHIPASALVGLFSDNKQLIGRRLALAYVERKFNHQPPWFNTVRRGLVNVEWQDERRFTFVSDFCGDTKIFSAEIP